MSYKTVDELASSLIISFSTAFLFVVSSHTGHFDVPWRSQTLFWLIRGCSLYLEQVSSNICIINAFTSLKFLLNFHFFKEAYADYLILNFNGNTYLSPRQDWFPLFCSTFMSSHGDFHFTTYFMLYFLICCLFYLPPSFSLL